MINRLWEYIHHLETEVLALKSDLNHIRYLMVKEKEEQQKRLNDLLDDMNDYFNQNNTKL